MQARGSAESHDLIGVDDIARASAMVVQNAVERSSANELQAQKASERGRGREREEGKRERSSGASGAHFYRRRGGERAEIDGMGRTMKL